MKISPRVAHRLKACYRYWSYSLLALILFTTTILVSAVKDIAWPIWLIWMQIPFYLLHEFEEHVFPGGFRQFMNREVFHSKHASSPLSQADIFWINIPFIWFAFPLFAVLARNVNIEFGTILPFIALFNASLHIILWIVKRKYNPGLLVSVFVNYPTGIYTVYYLLHHGYINFMDCLLSFLFALFAHAGIALYVIMQNKRVLAKQKPV